MACLILQYESACDSRGSVLKQICFHNAHMLMELYVLLAYVPVNWKIENISEHFVNDINSLVWHLTKIIVT